MKYILTTAFILLGFLSYSQSVDSPDSLYYGQNTKVDTFSKFVYVQINEDTIPKTQYRDVDGIRTGFIPDLRKNKQAVRNTEPGPTYNVVKEYYGQYYPNPGRTWVGWIGQ